MKKAEDTATEPRPFTQFLHEQRKGGLHDELSAQLAEVVAAVLETGKQGTLRIDLKIKPAGDGMVQVFDTTKAGVPVDDTAPSMFYADKHGNVSRSDPRQGEFPLKPVEAGGEAVRANG